MLLRYFNLQEQPFGVTPDPRFLYMSRAHREALASLIYGIESERGFLAMIAPPGMGKTTLLFQLLERLRSQARTAFLFNTQCDSSQLLGHLLADLGVEVAGSDPLKLHEQLNAILLRSSREGKRCVFIIDEAQNLGPEALETVRLLSNFETSRSKLLHIVVAGQPALAETLANPKLLQFRQRICMLARLRALNKKETAKYVSHRLRVAGAEGDEFFSRHALEVIARRSEGVPRLINNLCFNAMSLAFAMDRRVIDAAIVEEAATDMAFQAKWPELSFEAVEDGDDDEPEREIERKAASEHSASARRREARAAQRRSRESILARTEPAAPKPVVAQAVVPLAVPANEVEQKTEVEADVALLAGMSKEEAAPEEAEAASSLWQALPEIWRRISGAVARAEVRTLAAITVVTSALLLLGPESESSRPAADENRQSAPVVVHAAAPAASEAASEEKGAPIRERSEQRVRTAAVASVASEEIRPPAAFRGTEQEEAPALPKLTLPAQRPALGWVASDPVALPRLAANESGDQGTQE